MNLSTAKISELVGGELEGDPSLNITRLARIEEGEEGSLSFLHNPRYANHIYSTRSSAVLVGRDFRPEQGLNLTLIRVENPYISFRRLLEVYYRQKIAAPGIEQPSYVAESATVGKDVYIGAFVYIGKDAIIHDGVRLYPGCYIGDNVEVGADTIIFPNVTVHYDCKIGKGCILHSGVVIGSDGFGFAQDGNNGNLKVPQVGNVVLEDDVEVGANSCIDRATLGSTIIRRGVKLDNLIQIAHNVEIGEHTVMAAQSGVSGSTRIGRRCMIGGQTGLVGHITLADGTIITAQSGVSKSVTESGQVLRGAPAQPLKKQLALEAQLRAVPDLIRRIEELEQQLARITQTQLTPNA